MRKSIFLRLTILVLFCISSCSENKLILSPATIVENLGNEEIHFTATNNGEQADCSVDIIMKKDNTLFSKRTIKLGLMESGKTTNVIDKIEFPEGNSTVEVEGYCN